ncbi:Peroxiredoxin [Flavobacterium sp. 9R]|uniref:peroxiredoxin family protein n=1 Tax=Flavobacterium sp. 9R TaxID=2653143 RepID=UPI0012F14324|nr:peroxiredoxin family protein [Flavobacterium sp. 9R]VXC03161.1 Peroxiredoxin [Flavobacterium sp. 9R]
MKNFSIPTSIDASKKISFILVVCFLALSFKSCSGSDDDNSTTPPSSQNPVVGAKAPDFALNGVDGKQVKLSDFNGKVVVLFFFGNTCPSCKAAAPSIQSKLATPYASNSNYQIIGLDQWDGNVASVKSFQSTTGVTFPLLINASGTAAAYKTTYDRLVVIDKNGNIAFSGTKGAASDADTARAKVDQLLK